LCTLAGQRFAIGDITRRIAVSLGMTAALTFFAMHMNDVEMFGEIASIATFCNTPLCDQLQCAFGKDEDS